MILKLQIIIDIRIESVNDLQVKTIFLRMAH